MRLAAATEGADDPVDRRLFLPLPQTRPRRRRPHLHGSMVHRPRPSPRGGRIRPQSQGIAPPRRPRTCRRRRRPELSSRWWQHPPVCTTCYCFFVFPKSSRVTKRVGGAIWRPKLKCAQFLPVRLTLSHSQQLPRVNPTCSCQRGHAACREKSYVVSLTVIATVIQQRGSKSRMTKGHARTEALQFNQLVQQSQIRDRSLARLFPGKRRAIDRCTLGAESMADDGGRIRELPTFSDQAPTRPALEVYPTKTLRAGVSPPRRDTSPAM